MKEIDMNDVGTRIQHLSDLHELWSDGLAILLQGSYHTDLEKQLMTELETCLMHLENHMAKDYKQIDYAKEINKIGLIPPEDEPKQ